MPDYSNSNKSKEEKAQVTERPPVEKVVVGEVIVKKKKVRPGRKFREVMIAMDFRSTVDCVIYDILVPAAKAMFVNSVSEGANRLVNGENARSVYPRDNGRRSIITYDKIRPSDPRGVPMRDPRMAPPVPIGPRGTRREHFDYILSTREDAERILERMTDILDQYNFVSVADVEEMVGRRADHTDLKWGWNHLSGARVRTLAQGFLLDLPPIVELD